MIQCYSINQSKSQSLPKEFLLSASASSLYSKCSLNIFCEESDRHSIIWILKLYVYTALHYVHQHKYGDYWYNPPCIFCKKDSQEKLTSDHHWIVLFSLCSCVQQHLNAILDNKDTVQLSLFTSQESHWHPPGHGPELRVTEIKCQVSTVFIITAQLLIDPEQRHITVTPTIVTWSKSIKQRNIICDNQSPWDAS